MWTRSRSLKLSRVMTWIFIVLLVLAAVFLPNLLKWYFSHGNKASDLYPPMLCTLWACVPPSMTALICLERLLKNISAQEVFIERNVSLIRIVSWCCFAVSGIFLCFMFFNVFTLLVSVVAAFMALILRVVKNVIAQAVEIKAENDLTV